MTKFGESGHPSFPSHESIVPRNAPKRRRWKIIVALPCRWAYDWNCFSHNYLTISSASMEQFQMCEEYSICETKMEKHDLAGQSDPLFAPANLLIMTPRHSTDDLAQEILLHQYKERVEKLSQPSRLMKICIDAGFLKTVKVGQYSMTKHTDEFLQFTEPVTCREYTLPWDGKPTDPKGWCEGIPKWGPCWKSQPVTCKVNMEWKFKLNL